jgi:hypothetical protein
MAIKKKLYEIDMLEKPVKPAKEKVAKKTRKEEPVVDVVEPVATEPDHPTTGGKTLETLKLLKKPPSEAQLAARERAKEKRALKKKELEDEAKRILEENERKEREAKALAEAKSLKRKEKAAERKRQKEEEAATLQKPLDQTPPAPVAVSIKNEGKKLYKVPEEHVFKPSTVVQPKRVGMWNVVGGSRRMR